MLLIGVNMPLNTNEGSVFMFKTFVIAGEHTTGLESGVEGKIRKFLEDNPSKTEVSRTTSISCCSVGSHHSEFHYTLVVTCEFK